jgi:ASC-1-like (ASCH) protein
MNKQLSFNSTPTIIYDPENLADDLREYRKSNIFQKKMDALRMEKLLSPILTVTHRLKIWKKLYSSAFV